MKHKNIITLGPGAPSLILIFVVLAMTMLGILALMHGRNDKLLSERSFHAGMARYQLDTKAQESRAELDALMAASQAGAEDDSAYLRALSASLPEKYTLETGSDPEDGFDRVLGEEELARIIWSEADEVRTLKCMLAVMPMESRHRGEWLEHRLVSTAMDESEQVEEEILFDW